MKKAPLSKERICQAALKLIEQDGLQSFSMRKLGQVLSVEAMSLYHHFPSKAHVLDAILDQLFAGFTTLPTSRPFAERLRDAAYAYRAIAHRYPRFFQYVLVHRMNTREGLRFIEQIAGLFPDTNPRKAAQMFRAFGYYLTGAILDETSGYAQGPSAAEPVPPKEQAEIAPKLIAMGPYFAKKEWDAIFDFGLDAFIAYMNKQASP